YYDCIIIDVTKENICNFESLMPIAKNLCPGGRLIFKSLSFSPEIIDDYFEVEVAYHNVAKMVWCEYFGCKEIVGDIDGLYVLMKSPLVENDFFEFREKTYLYSTPPEHLINFAASYSNPWLVKSMIEFPTRNLNKNALARYADTVINNYNELTPDYGSALAIIGYQAIQGDQNRKEIIGKINGYIDKVTSLDNKTAHQIRWLISLSVLGGELLKLDGDNVSALSLYRKATLFSYKDFSPTIGTKILQAYYNIAVIDYCSGKKEQASQSLNEALDEGIKILNVSFSELLGEKSSPLTFTLFIYHDVLDWIIKLSNFKRHLNDRVELVPKLNSQTWSGILRERMTAINNMSTMIASRDITINAQSKLLEERLQSMHEMTDVIDAQKSMIDERWEAMQTMEKLIEDRWVAMQEMEKMINERDATIEQLKKH
ncbi:hypothetical protein ACCY16_18390, partial [Candidatus Pantoea formicae]|uniref:hypothetical protein n=1 Tax=Candidatus Pantoea formicae TaxID=2608355 RepID=UPI003EDA5ED4